MAIENVWFRKFPLAPWGFTPWGREGRSWEVGIIIFEISAKSYLLVCGIKLMAIEKVWFRKLPLAPPCLGFTPQGNAWEVVVIIYEISTKSYLYVCGIMPNRLRDQCASWYNSSLGHAKKDLKNQ